MLTKLHPTGVIVTSDRNKQTIEYDPGDLIVGGQFNSFYFLELAFSIGFLLGIWVGKNCR